jgi:hypothetical protein
VAPRDAAPVARAVGGAAARAHSHRVLGSFPRAAAPETSEGAGA